MQPLQPFSIIGSSAGLELDKKPFILPDQAFPTLKNAYVWRDRVVKKLGNELIGRLRRVLTVLSLGNTVGAQTTYTFADIFASFIPAVGAGETNKEIEPGSLVITIGAPDAATFTDNGDGTFIVTGVGVSAGSFINYATGAVTIVLSASAGGAAITANINYFPSLPVMGIWAREISTENDEQTIWWDTKYAYIDSGSGFNEFLAATATTWDGTDSDFFWATNYRGSNAFTRLFFVTNFVNTATNPIRYTDGVTWTSFNPLVSAADNLYQARILIPYYGRLLAFNTWEGTTAGGYAGANNFFNRCRFSQIGSPVAVDAWRSDQFGKGGFIDAPTNESIISATFFKNTLIVGFERSTWQLRYVGEYGLPFLWERISSDFGTESQFSCILFDHGVASVGDRAIVLANAVNLQRMDEQIPDIVFTFRNLGEGLKRVNGVRDFQKELVYWCYSDTQNNEPRKFPNRVLLYNYRNNTYAQFRELVTFFGTHQTINGVTWDRTDIYWDDDDVYWDDVDDQIRFPRTVIGNQEGFVHFYGYTTALEDQAALSITDFDRTADPFRITVVNHNLENQEIIQIMGLQFIDTVTSTVEATNINDEIFSVVRVDDDTLELYKWDTTQQNYLAFNYTNFPTITPVVGVGTYIGGGTVTLLPKMQIQTKDFNPYQQQGTQAKISYIDFLTDATPDSEVTIKLFLNSSIANQANMLTGNQSVETNLPSPYYIPGSNYSWHRFFATSTGQYIRVEITYGDDLMNVANTHESQYVLNAITLWMRPGSKNIF